MRTISTKDIKSFKRADSIENFYDIQKIVGHGMFISLFHLYF